MRQPSDSSAAPEGCKPWWLSRTLWFNALCAMLAAAEAGFGLLQPVLPINLYALLSFALPVGNALLRVLTSKGISGTERAAT